MVISFGNRKWVYITKNEPQLSKCFRFRGNWKFDRIDMLVAWKVKHWKFHRNIIYELDNIVLMICTRFEYKSTFMQNAISPARTQRTHAVFVRLSFSDKPSTKSIIVFPFTYNTHNFSIKANNIETVLAIDFYVSGRSLIRDPYWIDIWNFCLVAFVCFSCFVFFSCIFWFEDFMWLFHEIYLQQKCFPDVFYCHCHVRTIDLTSVFGFFFSKSRLIVLCC